MQNVSLSKGLALLTLVPLAALASPHFFSMLKPEIAKVESTEQEIAEHVVAPIVTDPIENARKIAQEGLPSIVDAVKQEFIPAAEADFKFIDGSWKAAPASIVPTQEANIQRAPSMVPGYYITKDYPTNSPNSFTSRAVQLVERNDSVLMLNVYTNGTKIAFQDEGSYWSIPAQVMYTHSTYGEIWIVPINPNQGTYDTEGKVTVVVDAQGNMRLTPWAIMIVSGQYAGNAFGAYSRSEWKVSNASVKITDIGDNVYSYPMLIEQTYSNRLALYNMVGYGGYIEAAITPAKSLSITPQFMLNNPFMGDFYCYAADWETSKIMTNVNISGKATATGFELDDWAIALRANPGQSILQAAKTEITSSLNVKYPTPIGGNFTGSGTAADPYQIATSTDLFRMAQYTADGETMTGKYFSVTTDIDLASADAAWDPIGSPSYPFKGIVKGNGHAIKNLSTHGRGNNYFALFGYLGPEASIDGLNMADCVVNGTGDCVGGLAAWSEGKITNCNFTGTVNAGGNWTGAIAAVNVGSISQCSVSGTVAGMGDVGALVGQNYGQMTFCHSDAAVRCTGYFSSIYHCVGGLVGMLSPLQQSEALLADSYFCGSISDTVGYATMGGLCGGIVLGKMERCFNVGMISASRASSETDTSTGGLVGLLSGTVVSDCFNAGTILKNQTSDNVGGLIGYLSCTYRGSELADKNTVTNCYDSGYIRSSSSDGKKGIFGTTFELSGFKPAPYMIFNCYFDSQVTGLDSEEYGKPSAFFTSGSLPTGFSSDVWTATAGRYPMLKNLQNTDAARLAVAFLQLADAETVNKVKKSVTLNAGEGISWGMLADSQIVSQTPSLSLSGNTLTIGSSYGTDVVVAYTPQMKSMKAYYLKVVPKVFDGEGTQASPYLIKNKNDFKILNQAVATYGQPHEGDYFKLTTDIDFGYATDFYGVGVTTSNPFGGTFDGDGHTLSKLRIHTIAYDADGKAITTGSYNYGGLFAVLSSTATVRNITMAADCDFDFWGLSGPIAGYTAGRIENCRNYAPVTALYQYAGGIVGAQMSGSVIDGCYNSGSVTIGNEYVGGIAGLSQGIISNCQNDGDITATQTNDAITNKNKTGAGGIAGLAYGSVESCVNNATIIATRYVGGLVGSGIRVGMTNCLNNGIVTCTSDADTRGAMIGHLSSRGTMTGNRFDTSINPFGAANGLGVAGLTGLSTSQLVSGQAIDGFPADKWDYASGKYPVLKQFASESASEKLRTMYVRFGEGEVRTNVVNAVALSSPQGISWKLLNNKNFTISGTTLNVTQPTELVVATDTLTATLGAYKKVYDLKSIPNVLDGRGTEASPFLICTPEDFNKLSDFIASSKMDYNGFFFRVENNLDFTGKEFHPIALGNLKFQADFNGNGKTISGFTYENTSVTDGLGRYVGFFGTLGEASFVHDLTLNGKIIANADAGGFAARLYGRLNNCVNRSQVSVSGSSVVAGFVARAFEGSSISNCVNYGTITAQGRNEAGGIVGRAINMTITDCSNEGPVTATAQAGGIAVSLSGEISGCVNKGKIETTSTGTSNAAGIVCTGSQGTLTISNCSNEANITIPGTRVAGIIGEAARYSTSNGEPVDGCFVTMTNCFNTGNLSAKGYVSGVAYSLEGGVNISGCYNKGVIKADANGYAGGAFGSLSPDPRRENLVYNCWNEGQVLSAGRQNGGFAQGISEGVNVENCYNIADVTTTYTGDASSQAFTAGFVAYCNGNYYRCWNSGNVTSSQFAVSGFASYGSGVIEECFNLGDVTYTGSVTPAANFGGAAGLWNQGQNTSISCYNLGTIKATCQACGLHSAAWNGASLIDCYNAGDVIVTGTSKTRSDVLVSRRPNVLSGESVMTGLFYATDALTDKSIPNSMQGTGLTLKELRSAELGDNFVYDQAALPSIGELLQPSRQSLAVAGYAFKTETDTPSTVTNCIYFPALPGLEITATNDAVVGSNNVVYPQKEGDLKVTLGAEGTQLTKVFDFKVTRVAGVDEINAGREVAERKYYDLSGRRLASPLQSEVTVVVTRYTDGTIETRRILMAD